MFELSEQEREKLRVERRTLLEKHRIPLSPPHEYFQMIQRMEQSAADRMLTKEQQRQQLGVG